MKHLKRLKACIPIDGTVVRTSLIVFAMACCVGVGLWLHNAYVGAHSTWAARENAYAALDKAATDLMFQLRTLDSSMVNELAPPDVTAASPVVTAAVKALSSQQIQLAFADTNWQISGFDSDEYGQTAIRATALSWRPAVEDLASARLFQRGILLDDTNVSPAVAWDLGHDRGFGLVYVKSADIVPDAATIRSAMPFAGLIAFVWVAGVQSVIVYLALSKLETDSRQRQEKSESQALRQTQELVRTQDAIIFGLAKLAESRDTDTGQHLERISLYSTRLAEAMRARPRFRDVITPSFVRLIGISSALHDIGKVGVADSILKKPGSLSDEERSNMQQHAQIGGECLQQIEKRLGPSNFLQMAREIGLYHHERWDGQGYPFQLRGEEIPLAARIVAICDVYDALSNRRCYKEAYSHLKCVKLISEGSGSQFDPHVTDVFLEIESEFRLIALHYQDSAEPVIRETTDNCEHKAITLVDSQTSSDSNDMQLLLESTMAGAVGVPTIE